MRKQMGIMSVMAVLAAVGAVSADVLETAEPGALFIEGSNVVFSAAAAVEGVDAHVVDVFGAEMRCGRVMNGRLDVGTLPKGYYVARVANGEQTETRSFGVVVDPARRVRDAESPFAIDAALAAIVPKDANYARMLDWYAEVLRRAGVVNVRDRFHQQLDANGEYRWGAYGQAADALARSGARVSETMHVFAPSRRLAGSSEPRSLIEVYDFARCQAERFPSVAIWEFWNETELTSFWNGSAWGAAAAMKAAALGWKDGNAACHVTQPSYCQHPLTENMFARMLLANGGGDYFDIYNIHIYSGLAAFRGVLDDLRKLCAEFGIDDPQVIVSEIGLVNEGQGLTARADGKAWIHSAEQEMLGAEFYPKQQILSQHLGVAAAYAFCLPAYHEQGGRKDWGLMRADATAKPGLVAFAAMTEQLSGCTAMGRVKLAPGVTGYLYRRPAGQKTLAYWSESKLDQTSTQGLIRHEGDLLSRQFTIPAKGTLRLAGVFGTPGAAEVADGRATLVATRFVQYATGRFDLPLAEAARPAGTLNPRTQSNEVEKRVILRALPGEGVALRSDRMSLGADAEATNRWFVLEITNLSETPRRGTLSASEDWLRLPEVIEIAPRSVVRLEIAVPADVPTGYRAVTITGEFDGKRITPLVFNFSVRTRGEPEPLAKWDAPESWRKNSSSKSETISYDMQDAAVRVDTEFPEGVDRWVYPYYKFPAGALPKGATGLRFKFKVAEVPGKEQKRRRGLVMLNGADADGRKIKFWPEFWYSPDGEWRAVEVDFGAIKSDTIKSLQIGINPCEEKSTYWFKDLKLQ